MRLDDGLGTVTGAIFKSFAAGDPGFTVKARAFALCLGGIENPRAAAQLPQPDPDTASATTTTSSAATSASIRTSGSGRSTTTSRSPRRRSLAPEEAYAPTEAFLEAHGSLDLLAPRHADDRAAARASPPSSSAAPAASPRFSEQCSRRCSARTSTASAAASAMYLAQDGGRGAVQGAVAIHAEQALHRDSRVTLADERGPPSACGASPSTGS